MKRAPLLFVTGLLLVVMLGAFSHTVYADVTDSHTAKNLALTAGAGSWETGGYHFDGSASYAKLTSFRPLHGKTALSFVLWLRADVIPTTTDDVIFTQYVDTNNRIQVTNKITGGIEYRIGNGSTNKLVLSANITATKLYCVIGAWSASDNNGLISLYVNNTLTVSSQNLKGSTSGDADLNLGRHSSGYYFDGSIYTFSIYYDKISASQAEILYRSGPDTVLSTVDYFYSLNEGSGTTFTDWSKAWVDNSLTWSLDQVAANLEWQSTANETLDLETAVRAWTTSISWAVDLLTHSIFPAFDQDSWFYVLILAFVGALACFGMVAYMISEGDYDVTTISILGMVGVFALLICIGVILV